MTQNAQGKAAQVISDEAQGDEGVFDSLVNTVRANPVASLAVGAALFALTRTPAGKVLRPAISLAISSGAAGALANAVIRQYSRK